MPEEYKNKNKEAIYWELVKAQQELSQLKRMIFGTKSERFVAGSAPEQLRLDLNGQEVVADPPTVKQTITYQRTKPKKKQAGRQALPADLPRVKIVIEPQQDVSGWKKIGEEITEELDYLPGRFQVIQYIRPKYLKAQAEQGQEVENPIVIAPLPGRVIDKGIPSAGLLAYLLISKFIDHLPYYRQIKIFERIGMKIKASTINGWMAKTCVLLKVLYDKFCEHHFAQSYLQADETTIKVLKTNKRGKGKAHKGYFWVYNDPLSKNVVFRYDAGRGRKYPAEHLQKFSGHLQTDGLSVYHAFDKRSDVQLYACMAHVRRKFVEAIDNDRERSEYVLQKIQQLYAIEQAAREQGYSHQQRYDLRQQKAKPIMAALKTYLDQELASSRVLPKSAIGKAIAHALNRWKYLERYLQDGRIEIDNNLVENAIRPVALGRKNYLFAGSEQGAQWAAILYTLLGSAIQHGHNPLDYLKDVLKRLPDTRINALEQLFPANWKLPDKSVAAPTQKDSSPH